MTSVCVSRCVKDAARAPVVVVRATYENLYKWPESDAEFIRSVTGNLRSSAGVHHPRVVHSISCRQLYLRSYTFSREEGGGGGNRKEEETGRKRKCSGGGGHGRRNKKCFKFRRIMVSIFRGLLSCTAKVDVVG